MEVVITDTALTYAASWKKMFDEYLERRSAGTGEKFELFDIDTDYYLH